MTPRRRSASVALAALLVLVHAGAAAASDETIARARELARSAPGTRITITGTVTRARPGRSLSVQDSTGSIFAYTEQEDLVPAGAIVEISGQTAVDSEGAPCLDHASFRQIGSGEPPAPQPVTAEDLAAGRYDAALVSIEATLERFDTARYEYGLILSDDDAQFTAWVLRDSAGKATAIPLHSRVRVVGVASRTNEPDGHNGFELLMRNGADAVILTRPPWWTSPRLAAVSTALAGALMTVISYALLLRRQVRRQTALIAERMRAEADLKEQYRQAQKMEAVGRLAGGIAHDFNNIMTVVLGHADVLGVELRGNPEMVESVDEIKKAVERASGVTRQLLAFGRRQHLETKPVDLNAVVASMATLLQRVLRGDIAVRAETATAPVLVTIDRGQLEQALLNLAVNARDAMADGGSLTLSVGSDDGSAVVRVADTGCGIPAEAQPHVFEPFFTTKDVGQGSGLGLAMVYGFVQQSGGRIRFETAEGHGTTFEMRFPLLAGAES